MTVYWIFNGGRLEARDDAGKLLRGWTADEQFGRQFAELLGHNQALSRLLLWPLLDSQSDPQLSTVIHSD